jgi:hypothetical protein
VSSRKLKSQANDLPHPNDGGVVITLPREAVEEFKQLYEKHYGVELSYAEAEFRAQNWLKLYSLVYAENDTESLNTPT